jgi:hypothetical protein
VRSATVSAGVDVVLKTKGLSGLKVPKYRATSVFIQMCYAVSSVANGAVTAKKTCARAHRPEDTVLSCFDVPVQRGFAHAGCLRYLWDAVLFAVVHLQSQFDFVTIG